MGAIERMAAGGQRLVREPNWGLDQPMIGVAISLCSVLLIAGCGPRMATKADDAAHRPNPMLNPSYSEAAVVPFVIKTKAAMPLRAKASE